MKGSIPSPAVAILISILIGAFLSRPTIVDAAQATRPDVLVVGAGISGLSAALEAAEAGVKVEVIDMWSIFGGHAVMSEGGLCIVKTPFQEGRGIEDSPDLAYRDFVEWGGDPDTDWVRFYVDNSRELIYDWLTEMGVGFDGVSRPGGNSVPRFHRTTGRGLGLVSPIYRECVRHPNVRFRWNFKVSGLLEEAGRVVGVRGENLRSRNIEEHRAYVVILATGGFQSNLEMVRAFWPDNLPFPDRILAGSGVNSKGSGHEIARQAGAGYHRMDHQWNYSTGLRDPRYPGEDRGLNAHNSDAVWVNAQAKRFVNERGGTKVTFPALVKQMPATYWAIFDEKAKRSFSISGSDWGDFSTIERVIYDNEDLVKSAGSIEALAELVGLAPIQLSETVTRYNTMVDVGVDEDFQRFDASTESRPARIDQPPYYAVQFFPLTRKSMGGVAIDHSCRVLDQAGKPIEGLYAAGELTGFGGVNGWAGLEGTFLGPSIVTGRVAGRAVAKQIGGTRSLEPAPLDPKPSVPSASQIANTEQCLTCHELPDLVRESRLGYSHFEKAHRLVLEREYNCGQCHTELTPYAAGNHVIDRLGQIDNCAFCHVAEER